MHLRTEPAESPQEECAAVGRETLSLTLVATKQGEEAESPIEVVQLLGDPKEPVVLRTNALDGTSVVATGEKNVDLWASGVIVTSVAACGHRSIQVVHEGKTASLAPDGTPSSSLGGTALGGPWELRSPLSPEELQDPPARPKELKILASIRCKKEPR